MGVGRHLSASGRPVLAPAAHALTFSSVQQSWNFPSNLGQPMRIGMIGPQTKKNHRPINDRIPAIFAFNGNFNGEMAQF